MALASIICIDRDTFIRQLVAQIFDPIRVTAVSSADKALELLEMQKFDLVILENVVTDGKGLALCRRLRRSDIKTPVLFIAGSGSVTPNEVRSAGAQGLIVKGPAFVGDLELKVKELFGQDAFEYGRI